jgi:hypothetical protein
MAQAACKHHFHVMEDLLAGEEITHVVAMTHTCLYIDFSKIDARLGK